MRYHLLLRVERIPFASIRRVILADNRYQGPDRITRYWQFRTEGDVLNLLAGEDPDSMQLLRELVRRLAWPSPES